MIPKHINPTMVRQEMQIDEYHQSQVGGRATGGVRKGGTSTRAKGKGKKQGGAEGEHDWVLTSAQMHTLQVCT
jgi:hypothetical protein